VIVKGGIDLGESGRIRADRLSSEIGFLFVDPRREDGVRNQNFEWTWIKLTKSKTCSNQKLRLSHLND